MRGDEVEPGAGAVAGDRARVTNVVAVTAVVVMAAAVAVVYRRPALVTYTDVTPPVRPSPSPTTTSTPLPGAGQAPTVPVPDLSGYGPDLTRLFVFGCAAVALAATCWLVVALVRAIGLRHRRLHTPPVALAPPLATLVAESVEHSLTDLSVGTPDNAIIRCWVGLQDAARAAGIEPRPSETSAELTVRLLDELSVDRASVSRLAALYREARFSTHDLTEDDRAAALAALTAIRRSLPDAAVSHA